MLNPYKIPSIAGAANDTQRAVAFRRLSNSALIDLEWQFRTQLIQVRTELDRRTDRLTIPSPIGAA